jgi:hypothetical protein
LAVNVRTVSLTPTRGWLEFSPPGHGAVDHPAGEQIRDRVPQAYDEEHGADRGGGNADHVGVIEQQECRAKGEGEIVRQVAGTVADHRPQREFHDFRPFGSADSVHEPSRFPDRGGNRLPSVPASGRE